MSINRQMRLVAVVAGILVVAGGATWALWPAPPPPEAAVDKGEMDRKETEELMRQIGYVQ